MHDPWGVERIEHMGLMRKITKATDNNAMLGKNIK
jgi:hypothetical protein